MGVSSTLSSIILCDDQVSSDLKFSDMDPTTILKLHSILSGLDTFELSKKYDYQLSEESSSVISMTLPNNLVCYLRELQTVNKVSVLLEWHKSQEVRLNNWEELQTSMNLESLMEAARKHKSPFKIEMFLNRKPSFYN